MDGFLDFIYQNQFLVILLSIGLGLFSNLLVKGNFEKYSKVAGNVSLTGTEVAKKIMHANGVYDVEIEITDNFLGDHYDPRNKVVRLSPGVANSNSIASQAIAAHEVGHVLQYAQGSKLIAIRNAFLPLAQLGSKGVWVAIILGIFFQMTGLIYLGILAFMGILLFQVATLPVEFDASSRAMKQLNDLSIVSLDNQEGVKKVLSSAALTYVVAVVASILTILRLLSIARRR
ncbi:MAG: zinc metallopeptidase [Bacilli bacterium]